MATWTARSAGGTPSRSAPGRGRGTFTKGSVWLFLFLFLRFRVLREAGRPISRLIAKLLPEKGVTCAPWWCSPRPAAPGRGPRCHRLAWPAALGHRPVPGRDPSAGRTLRPPCTDPACLHQGPCIAVLRRGGTLVPPSGGRTWEARLVTVQVTPLPGQWQQRRHPGCWSPASWSAPVGARPPPPSSPAVPGRPQGSHSLVNL